METPTVGKQLRLFRESRNMKQGEFCDYTGIKQQTVSGIETGRSEPSTAMLQLLFTKFPDLNPDWLLLGTGSMLRDGRTLTPAPAPTTEPEPPTPAGGLAASPGGAPVPGEATPAQADYIGRLIRVLEDELEASKQRAGYWQERAERLEKPSPAPSATRSLPAPPISLRPTACTAPEAPENRQAGKVVALWPATERVLAVA